MHESHFPRPSLHLLQSCEDPRGATGRISGMHLIGRRRRSTEVQICSSRATATVKLEVLDHVETVDAISNSGSPKSYSCSSGGLRCSTLPRSDRRPRRGHCEHPGLQRRTHRHAARNPGQSGSEAASADAGWRSSKAASAAAASAAAAFAAAAFASALGPIPKSGPGHLRRSCTVLFLECTKTFLHQRPGAVGGRKGLRQPVQLAEVEAPGADLLQAALPD